MSQPYRAYANDPTGDKIIAESTDQELIAHTQQTRDDWMSIK